MPPVPAPPASPLPPDDPDFPPHAAAATLTSKDRMHRTARRAFMFASLAAGSLPSKTDVGGRSS